MPYTRFQLRASCFVLPTIILFSFLSSLRPLAAQSARDSYTLTDEASVSVLTCAPGDELYSVFGHSAIRISDPVRNIDLAFNYGTFDFNTSFFYLKFAHGTLDYILSVTTFRQFMQEYFITGRAVWEQTIKMNPQEKNALFDALLEKAKPQNRAYRYDFFHDNCATRVRDAAIAPIAEQVKAPIQGSGLKLTFREAISPYLAGKPWTRVGISLILGSPADAQTDFWSVMFLPDYLMAGFEQLQMIDTPEGYTGPLVVETTQLLDFKQEENSSSAFSPLVVLWLLFVVTSFITLGEYYGVMHLPWLNPLLFILLGLTGLLIGYLSFVSQHVATGHNWNFLWANPVWFLLVTNVNNGWRKWLTKGMFLVILFMLFFSWSLTQSFPMALLPVWLLLGLRLFIKITGR